MENKNLCAEIREHIEKGIAENAERMKAEWLSKGYTKEQVNAMARGKEFQSESK